MEDTVLSDGVAIIKAGRTCPAKSIDEVIRVDHVHVFFFLVGDGLKSPVDGNKSRLLPRVKFQLEDAESGLNNDPSTRKQA